MPIQLTICERRDNADRAEMGNTAFALCKAMRARDGISSSRYFWHNADTIVFWSEGTSEALDAQDGAEFMQAAFALADLARVTSNLKLMDPQAGVENYRMAGR